MGWTMAERCRWFTVLHTTYGRVADEGVQGVQDEYNGLTFIEVTTGSETGSQRISAETLSVPPRTSSDRRPRPPISVSSVDEPGTTLLADRSHGPDPCSVHPIPAVASARHPFQWGAGCVTQSS